MLKTFSLEFASTSVSVMENVGKFSVFLTRSNTVNVEKSDEIYRIKISETISFKNFPHYQERQNDQSG